MSRYIDWDFDRMTATEYERQGECCACGQCCTGEVCYIFYGAVANEESEVMKARGGGVGADREGVWQEVQESELRIYRKFVEHIQTDHVCPELVEGSKCGRHGPDKPKFCILWPISPREIAPFQGCSYAFVKIAEWPIEVEEVT
jgi:hypothetical protein